MCGKSCQKCDDWPSAGPSPGVDTILSSIDHIVSEHSQHQYFTRLTARIKFKLRLRNSELETQTVEIFIILGVGSNRPQKYSLALSWHQFSHGCVIMQMTTNVVSNLTSPDSGKAPLEKQEIIRHPPPPLPSTSSSSGALITECSVSASHSPNTFSSIIVWESHTSPASFLLLWVGIITTGSNTTDCGAPYWMFVWQCRLDDRQMASPSSNRIICPLSCSSLHLVHWPGIYSDPATALPSTIRWHQRSSPAVIRWEDKTFPMLNISGRSKILMRAISAFYGLIIGSQCCQSGRECY